MFLFCPETSYERAEIRDIGLETDNYAKEVIDVPKKDEFHDSEKSRTFLEQLRPYRGIESTERFWNIFIRPLHLLLFPQIIYVYVVYGISLGWAVAVYNLTALIFGSPPYNMSVTKIGLLGIGSLISAILGFMAGSISDWLSKFMARRNGGIYEPEAPFSYNFQADDSFGL